MSMGSQGHGTINYPPLEEELNLSYARYQQLCAFMRERGIQATGHVHGRNTLPLDAVQEAAAEFGWLGW